MTLFGGLQIGSEALKAQQRATEVVGHNIANVNTPGYSRQRAQFVNKQGVGTVDVQGVAITQIVREVDVYLTKAIRDQGSRLESFDVQNKYVQQVEQIFNAFEDTDIATALDKFFIAAQDLSDNPEDSGFREAFISASEQVAFHFSNTAIQLSDIKEQANDDVDVLVDDINNLTTEIAQLNVEIIKLEQGGPQYQGNNANDLRDQRDQRLKELGEIVPITVHEQANGSVIVNVKGENIIHDGIADEVSVLSENVSGEVIKTIVIKDNLRPLEVHGQGKLGGTYESRDTIIGDALTDLNTLANTFMNAVNAIQTTGYGLQGYDKVTSWEAATTTNVPLNSSGFSRTVVHGSFNIQVREPDDSVTTVNIQVDVDGLGQDTSLESLILEINQKLTAAGITDVSASIDNSGYAILESNADRTFSFTDDSSGVLNVLGWGALFDGNSAQTMAVNQQIAGNVDLIAAGLSVASSDNTNMLNMVELRDQKIMNSNSETIEEGFLSLLSGVGTKAALTASSFQNQESLVLSLENERVERIGVNIDMEVIDLMKFQHAYESAARFVNTVNDLLDTLINGLF